MHHLLVLGPQQSGQPVAGPFEFFPQGSQVVVVVVVGIHDAEVPETNLPFLPNQKNVAVQSKGNSQ